MISANSCSCAGSWQNCLRSIGIRTAPATAPALARATRGGGPAPAPYAPGLGRQPPYELGRTGPPRPAPTHWVLVLPAGPPQRRGGPVPCAGRCRRCAGRPAGARRRPACRRAGRAAAGPRPARPAPRRPRRGPPDGQPRLVRRPNPFDDLGGREQLRGAHVDGSQPCQGRLPFHERLLVLHVDVLREPGPSDDRGHREPLDQQGQQDHAKGDEDDSVASGHVLG